MEIITTSADHIPTKKIVRVIGEVYSARTIWISSSEEKCIRKLKEKAAKLGANAIINVIYDHGGFLSGKESARGLAVIVE